MVFDIVLQADIALSSRGGGALTASVAFAAGAATKAVAAAVVLDAFAGG